jgi:hypothetical protein
MKEGGGRGKSGDQKRPDEGVTKRDKSKASRKELGDVDLGMD